MKTFKYFFICLCWITSAIAQEKKVTNDLYLDGNEFTDGDTVMLSVTKYAGNHPDYHFSQAIPGVVKEHHLEYHWDAKTYPQTVIIQFKKRPNIPFEVFEVYPGSKVHIVYGEKSILIHEKQFNNIAVQYELDSIVRAYGKLHTNPPKFSAGTFRERFAFDDSLTNIQLSYIEKEKNRLSPRYYVHLKNSIKLSANGVHYWDFVWHATKRGKFDTTIVEGFKKFLPTYKMYVIDKEDWLGFSAAYFYYQKYFYKAVHCYMNYRDIDYLEELKFHDRKLIGPERENMIAEIAYATKDLSFEMGDELRKISKTLKNNDYKDFIKVNLFRFNGQKAYNFSLSDTLGKKVNLADLSGKLIILDFWFTGCNNCIKLNPIIKRQEELFKGQPVLFVSVSIDKSKATWIRSIKTGDYTTPNGLNLYTNGIGYADPVTKYYHIYGCPQIVLISKDGRVVNLRNDPRADDGVELSQAIKKFM